MELGFLQFVSIEGLTAEQAKAVPAEQLAVLRARDCLRTVWGDASQPDTVLDSSEPYGCSGYAITLATAGEWFGYSVVGESEALATVLEVEDPTDFATLVAHRKANKGAPWTDSMRLIALEERERRDESVKTKKGAAAAIAGDLGITVKSLNILLIKAREARKGAATQKNNVLGLRSAAK